MCYVSLSCGLISRLAKAILMMHQKSNVKLKYVLSCICNYNANTDTGVHMQC